MENQPRGILLSQEEIDWGLENGLTTKEIELGVKLGYSPQVVLELKEKGHEVRKNGHGRPFSFTLNFDGTLALESAPDKEITLAYVRVFDHD